MRIPFGSSFDSGIRAISDAAEALASAQQQIASGRRLTRLSEDPIAAAGSIAEHATLDRLRFYESAGDAAASRLTLTDTVLSDIVSQLQAAQTTALSARGSAQTQSQRDAAANELIAIRDALMSDINTKFQGAYLFSGSESTTAPYVDTGTGISAYQGDTDASAVEVSTGRSVASTFDGSALLQGGDAAHVLDALTDLAAALVANDQAAIDSGVAAVERAFDRAVAAQARIGSDLRALDDARLVIVGAKNSSIARLSSLEDADLAEAATRLSQADTAYRAALAAVSTLGRISLMDYLK